jgi:nucleoside-diphosphate-sugar epimerase
MDDTAKDIPGPVLVTGATGFIGSRLTARLMAAGAPTRALVLPGDPVPSGWGRAVAVVRGDIRDADAVARAVGGSRTVFHLAARVGDWGPERDFREVTVEGTRHLLTAAEAVGSRVVLTSSVVVYGHHLGRARCHEGVAMGRPHGPYSRAKQAQERLAIEWAGAGRCDVRVVRPTNVYGPGSGPWVIGVTEVLKTGKPSLIGGGGRNAGLAHVDNVVDILLRAAGPRAVSGDVFNACDELPVTWARYFGDLAALVDAPAPGSVPGWLAWPLAWAAEAGGRLVRREARPLLTREAVHLLAADHDVPAARARDRLGHRPVTGYDEALAEIGETLRA